MDNVYVEFTHTHTHTQARTDFLYLFRVYISTLRPEHARVIYKLTFDFFKLNEQKYCRYQFVKLF